MVYLFFEIFMLFGGSYWLGCTTPFFYTLQIIAYVVDVSRGIDKSGEESWEIRPVVCFFHRSSRGRSRDTGIWRDSCMKATDSTRRSL